MTRSPSLHPCLVALEQIGVTHPLCRERAFVCVCVSVNAFKCYTILLNAKMSIRMKKERNEKEAGERFLASTHLTAHCMLL